VVLSPTECHKEISSCQQRKVCLQGDYYSASVAKSFCGRNIHLNFLLFVEAICGGWSGGVS